MTDAKLEPWEFDAIRDGYDSVARRSHSIRADCYLEEKFLAVERAQIFRRSWQFVCHENALAEPGRYLALEVAGQPVLALRTGAGELRAYYNVCRHRAHELLSGAGTTRRITCPYHAWTYDLDGALVNAPRAEHLENFDTADICLEAVRIEAFCHLVFVNLDPAAEALAAQAGDLGAEVMRYAPDLPELRFSRRLGYRVRANWKAVVDNFLECYHCPVAHKGFSSMIDMDTYRVGLGGIWSSHMAKAKSGPNKAYSVDGATVDDHAVWYLWPNMTLMRYPGRGNFMVWRFYPAGVGETLEEFDFYFETEQPTPAEEAALTFIDEVLQVEDINLVESVQRGMNTPAFDSGRYLVDPAGSGLSEHAVHHFHGLLLAAYRRAVDAPGPTR